jgi:site-specific recombinase XerD
MARRVVDQALIPRAGVSEETRRNIAASKSARTIRAYRADLADFERWCDSHDRRALPATPRTVANYVSHLYAIGIAPATITRRLSAISQAHKMAGHKSPAQAQTVRSTAAGIRRRAADDGRAHTRQAKAILVDELRAMVEALPDDLRGRRDRALLLVGFAAGMRRSELVGLDVADVIEEDDGLGGRGLAVTIRRSKTDQEGEGRTVGIVHGSHRPLTDPVAAVRDWREAAGIDAGPLFRSVDRAGRVGESRLSDRAVARIVKTAAARIGIDAGLVSGHSLRAGLATSAAAAGAPERAIMATTGHRSTATVRRYIRQGSKYIESSSRNLLAAQ